MYKLLIVDDEEIEREGMLNYIPWDKYNIDVIGTAWNGVEAYEQILKNKPDILLTDISMPVMNGIDLIKKVKENFDDIEFVVLSGYGEYEFTSKAMEIGVRHYILKPCDESKIADVISKVTINICEKKAKLQKEDNYQNIVRRLLPLVKSQIFLNMILGNEQVKEDYELFVAEMDSKLPEVLILGFRMEKGFSYLEQFVLDNIIVELIGNKFVLLATYINNDMLFLVDKNKKNKIEEVVKEAKHIFEKFKVNSNDNIFISASEVGNWDEISELYKQVQMLLYLSSMHKKEEVQYYQDILTPHKDSILLFDYNKIRKLSNYKEIIFEVYLIFLKMDIKNYRDSEKIKFSKWLLEFFYSENNLSLEELNNEELIEKIINIIYKKQGNKGNEDKKMNNILFNIFINFKNQKLSIQFLCKEILYMNEDYFGRIFKQRQKQKFTDFLLENRMNLAKELIIFHPKIKITVLADMLGYPPDGQYFSKVFKKEIGYAPTEFRKIAKSQM